MKGKNKVTTSRTVHGGMKLLTKEIEKNLPPLSVLANDENWLGPETSLVARFFAPVGGATWNIVAGSPDAEKFSRYDGDFNCYGCATLDGEVLGWATSPPFGLHVARDVKFRPRKLGEEFPGEFTEEG